MIDIKANRIDVGTPEGVSGDWMIDSFTVSQEEADDYNRVLKLRRSVSLMMSSDVHDMTAGTFKRLRHKDRGVVMTNTPMEVKTNAEFLEKAKGRVLVNGLGIGMVLEALLSKPEVEMVTVVEVSKDVISLTAGHFLGHINSGRLVIVHADCLERIPTVNERYDFVWHDIWDVISDANLPQMAMLKERFSAIAEWQGCWAEDLCIEMQERIKALCAKAGRSYEEFCEFAAAR